MKKITILAILCAVTLSAFSQNIFNKKENTTELFYKTLLDKKIWKINLQKQFIDLQR